MAQYSVDIVAKALGGSEVDKLANSFKNVETAAAKAQQGMGGAANNIRAFGAASNGAATAVGGLGTALAAALGPLLSIASALALVKKGLDVAFERGAAEQKLKNFTDSTEEYNAALGVAAQAAQRFGMSQTETSAALADVYGRLKGLGFGLKETSEIYMGFNAIAKASGTTAEDASGAFLQLSQALGSGKLQGDELRAILERMPQLAQAIAQSMGVSAAQIREMGQEGKITSEVIYNALSQAATASGDFSNKLNDQQKAMASLKQVVDQLLNTIGQVFAPAVIAGAEALAAVGQKLADWWGYIGDVIFPKVMQAIEPLRTALAEAFEGIDFSVIIDVVQNVLIKGFEMAVGVIGKFSQVLAIVVNGFKALADSSIMQGLLSAMGAIVDKLGLGGSKVKEWKKDQEKVTDAAADSVKEFSKMPPKLEDAKEAAKKLKEEQKQVTEAIKEASTAQTQAAQQAASAIDQQLSIAQARIQAEQAINGVLLEQAQRQLQAATSQKERIAVAKQIYDLTVQQAELELQSSEATIQAELEKSRLAVESAQLKERELAAIVSLAAAQGRVTQEHYAALAAQREAIGIAERAYGVAQQVASAQTQAAQALYQGKLNAADAAYQQNIVAKNTQTAAAAAGQFADNMQRAASAASKTAASMSAVQGMSTASAVGANYDFGPAGENAAFKAAYESALGRLQQDLAKTFISVEESQRRLNEINKQFFDAASEYNKRYWQENRKNMEEAWFKGGGGALPGMSSSGRVSAASSSIGSAMQQYGIGTSATMGTPQVNITTGPVTQMGGTNYVTMSDLQQATSTAARQGANLALSQLQNSPSVRRSIGVAR